MGELLDNSRFTLWGITSFGKADEETGFGCSGIGSKPGMYTKVAGCGRTVPAKYITDVFNIYLISWLSD